jgi:chromosome segregation ATPase
MPSKTSYPVLITSFEGLVEAANRTPEVQASMEPERQALAQTLAEIQSLRARQKELTALKQGVSQQLKAAMERAKEQRTQVQSIAKGKLGPKNELLVHFQVTPPRKRKRKPAEEEEPSGEKPGTEGGSTASGTAASGTPPGKPAA